MSNLNLGPVTQQLKDVSENAYAVIYMKSQGWLKRGQEGVRVWVDRVKPDQDIEIGAKVERILRNQLGYGTLEKEYSPNSEKLTVDYFPLAKERQEIIRASGGSRTVEYVPVAVYRTPGTNSQ